MPQQELFEKVRGSLLLLAVQRYPVLGARRVLLENDPRRLGLADPGGTYQGYPAVCGYALDDAIREFVPRREHCRTLGWSVSAPGCAAVHIECYFSDGREGLELRSDSAELQPEFDHSCGL